jgi:hypothetical protein
LFLIANDVLGDFIIDEQTLLSGDGMTTNERMNCRDARSTNTLGSGTTAVQCNWVDTDLNLLQGSKIGNKIWGEPFKGLYSGGEEGISPSLSLIGAVSEKYRCISGNLRWANRKKALQSR